MSTLCCSPSSISSADHGVAHAPRCSEGRFWRGCRQGAIQVIKSEIRVWFTGQDTCAHAGTRTGVCNFLVISFLSVPSWRFRTYLCMHASSVWSDNGGTKQGRQLVLHEEKCVAVIPLQIFWVSNIFRSLSKSSDADEFLKTLMTNAAHFTETLNEVEILLNEFWQASNRLTS